MRYRFLASLVAVLLLTGCTLPPHPDVVPDVSPPVPTASQPAPAPEPVRTPPPLQSFPVFVPDPLPPRLAVESATKGAKPLRPDTLIKEAHQAAYVEPSKRGYFAASAVHRFHWQAGKLYVVYVTPGQTTKIILPPGQTLAHEAMLDSNVWDVAHAKVGNELSRQSILFFTPLPDMGAKDTDLSLVSESGYSFDIHLRVGKVGMFAVTFELAPAAHVPIDEPALRSQ